MLQKIGLGVAPADAVDLLVECHGRIRSFLATAARLGAARDEPHDAIADAARQVRRYFTVALPLHARDEEDSILPRLRGRDPAVDRELATMVREHGEHEAPLLDLTEACAVLVAEPGRHAEVGPAVARAARELQLHFAAHLAREEDVVFAAVRRLLDPAADAEIVREIRGRRTGIAGTIR